MKSFYEIAIPHDDIISGKVNIDVFAADLGEVAKGRGPLEYRDAEVFFNKTHMTSGLEKLLNVIKERLEGEGGDPVIQLHTPFGGGKTHSLIAVYHKAKDWKAKRVVIVGTELNARAKLWEILEQQLDGEVSVMKGDTAPGKEKLRSVLERNQPVVILMDEVLQYMTKASGVKIGESTLAGQTLAFMQELTETAKSLERVVLLITLPSSHLEHFDRSGEVIYAQLQKVLGRVEKIYTPVGDDEISLVIRRRLFKKINEDDAKKVVKEVVKYFEAEKILPSGIEPTEYRDRFLNSYPFMPEVIEVLYHRWGSFPRFQRTRGVLRILALVISSIIRKNSKSPYISLADFNLGGSELQRELVEYIGQEYASVISQDITGVGSGSAKVDLAQSEAYKKLQLGTRTTTTVFMYSFSGGTEKGATLQEIKRSAGYIGVPASSIGDILEQLKDKLFYFQYQGGKYYFTNQPNLNRMVLIKKENIKDTEVAEVEERELRARIKDDKIKAFINPKSSRDVPDNEEIKLIVLGNNDKDRAKEFVEKKGENLRINKNTLVFLVPYEEIRKVLEERIKERIAYQRIKEDSSLNLTQEQKKEVESRLKEIEQRFDIRELYRLLWVPQMENGEIVIRTIDMGMPTAGIKKNIVEEAYEVLIKDGELIDNIHPNIINTKYLGNKQYVSTKQILESSYRVLGSLRVVSKETLMIGIRNGVEQGLFGLGREVEPGKVECEYFKEKAEASFDENEVIISQEYLQKLMKNKVQTDEHLVRNGVGEEVYSTHNKEDKLEKEESRYKGIEPTRHKIGLKFEIPEWKVSDVSQIIKLIRDKFKKVQVELRAEDGEITERDYQDKIIEGFNQIGAKLEEINE